MRAHVDIISNTLVKFERLAVGGVYDLSKNRFRTAKRVLLSCGCVDAFGMCSKH